MRINTNINIAKMTVFEECMKRWPDYQIDKLIEELAELTVALSDMKKKVRPEQRSSKKDVLLKHYAEKIVETCHADRPYRRTPIKNQSETNVAEEMADVMLCIDQVKFQHGISDGDVDEFVLKKLYRIGEKVGVIKISYEKFKSMYAL